jgi:hypothetical protein
MLARARFCTLILTVIAGSFGLVGCEGSNKPPEGVPEKAPEATSTEYQSYQSQPTGKGKPKGGHSSPGGTPTK